MKGATGESAGTATALEGNGFGRVVLTATDATQYALEGDRVIGSAFDSVFTHYLIAGIKSGEADTNADGKISVDELYDYVHDQVVTANPKQTPCKFTYKQQGDFIIARNPAPKVTPLALPAEVQRAMESGVAWERCGTVAFLEGWLQGDDRAKVAAARASLTTLVADDSRQVSTAATEALSKAPRDTLPEAERQARAEPERIVQVDSQRREQPQLIPTPTPTPIPTPTAIPTPTPAPATQTRPGTAVAGLVCSIVGMIVAAIPILAFVLGGIGVFLGRKAIKQIDASRGAMKGRTMAHWAWALGGVAIGLGLIVLIANLNTYVRYAQ